MNNPSKPLLIYSLYCGGLYGTERMALATLISLPNDFNKVLICPSGAAEKLAVEHGIPTLNFNSKLQFINTAFKLFFQHKSISVISSSVSHSLIFSLLSWVLLKKINHLHIVHGGADEINSYQKKRVLCFFNIRFIAVSNFVKQKLLSYGIATNKIKVLENFILTHDNLSRLPSPQWPPKRIVLVSRLDPIKRVDLLVSLLCKYPELNQFSFTIYGTGANITDLQKAADLKKLNIHYAGYCSDIIPEMQKYDLFLHLCPDEPFGLVILEAMLSGIPVLVPDSGGPADIIKQAFTGWMYKNTDIDDLAKQLNKFTLLSSNKLKMLTHQAHQEVLAKYSASAGSARYVNLISYKNK